MALNWVIFLPEIYTTGDWAATIDEYYWRNRLASRFFNDLCLCAPSAPFMENPGFIWCVFAHVQLGVLAWLIYGILIDIWPIIAANSLTLMLACIVLYLKITQNPN